MVTASILPLPRAVFYDTNGNPLAGGSVYTYVASTTTPKATWQDAGETALNSNPVTLDAQGSCLLYGQGAYSLQVADSNSNQIAAYSGLTVDPMSSVTALQTALARVTAPSGATLVGYLAPGGGAVGETVYAKLSQTASVADYGASPSATAAANTVAFQAAVTAGSAYVPPGAYNVSGTINIPSGSYLHGDGWGAVSIVSTSISASVFFFPNGTTGAGISGMTVTRSVTAIAGAYGVATASTGTLDDVEDIEVGNIKCSKHWNGFHLGPTNYSLFRNNVALECLNDNLVLISTAGTSGTYSNPLQWEIDGFLTEFSGGWGARVVGVAMTKANGTLPIGEWRGVSTFANTSGGILVIGTASSPIFSFRLGGRSFVGGDGYTEIYLDTSGSNHFIESAYIELAGQVSGIGPSHATPKTNLGVGIYISTNNGVVNINGVSVNGCSADGIYTAAAVYGALSGAVVITGCSITNNGVAAAAGSQNGVTVAAGSAVINGNFIGQWNTNPAALVYQQYGINIGVDSVVITNNNLTKNWGSANSGAYFSGPLVLTNSIISNNFGVPGSGGGLSPIGAASVLANATGVSALPTGVPVGSGLDISTGTLIATASGGSVTNVKAVNGIDTVVSGTIAAGGITTTGTVQLSAIAKNTLLGNFTAGTIAASPVATNPSVVLDSLASTPGAVLFRNNAGWVPLNIGASGAVITSNGTIPSWQAGAGTGTVTNVKGANGIDAVVSGTITAGGITNTGTIQLTAIGPGTVLANTGTGTVSPVATFPSFILDTFSPTQGAILMRGSAAWAGLAPGTSGQVLTTKGAAANPAWSPAGSGTVTGVTVGQGLITNTGTVGDTITTAGTIALASIIPQTVLANVTTGTVQPVPNNLSNVLDMSAATHTAGEVLVRNSGAWVALVPGASGQVLQTNGTAAVPSWVTAPGGGGTPGGVNGQVQYNNAGVFGGLSSASLTGLVNLFSTALSGAVPASGSAAGKYLRDDTTFANPLNNAAFSGTNPTFGAAYIGLSPSAALASPGHAAFPISATVNNFGFRWGIGATSAGTGTVTFDTPFATTCFGLIVVPVSAAPAQAMLSYNNSTISTVGATVYAANSAGTGITAGFFYLAVGY